MRIKDGYVLQKELIGRTGIEEIDDYLYCLVNVLELSVGNSLRSVFVIGSCAHGGYTSDSDLDYCLIWKQGSDPMHWRKGSSLVAYLDHISKYNIVLDPMYSGAESPLYDPAKLYDDSAGFEFPCGPILKLAVAKDSILLWGDDIRSRIAPGRTEDMTKEVVATPLNWIKRTHCDSLDARISYPLTDPSPEKEDLGYGDLHRVTLFVIHAARALVFLETSEFLFNKMKVADAFEAYVGGTWSEFVRDICDARYVTISQQEKQRRYMCACQRMTEFQNYFLERLASKNVDVSADFLDAQH